MATGIEAIVKPLLAPAIVVMSGVAGFFGRRVYNRLDTLEGAVQVTKEDVKVLQANYKDILKHIESTKRKLDRMDDKTDRKLDSLRDLVVKDLLERRSDHQKH